MTGQPINKEISQRICDHMNSDHKDSILKYVIYYGHIKNPKIAHMLEISPDEMKIDVDGEVICIPFKHTLLDSKDAHRTLVQMIKELPT